MQAISQSTCSNEQSCVTDPSCLCYYSGICEFRAKKADDAPVFVPNDPAGNYYYCKQ